jgi:hypothetical protein
MVILLIFYLHLVLITFGSIVACKHHGIMSFVLLYFMIPFHKTELWLKMLPTSCGVGP